MSVRRRRLLMGRGRGWAERFAGDALSTRWTTDHGTPSVSGGALTASALAADGYNVVRNSEFTDDDSEWGYQNVSHSRVDSESDPGANSGGNDKWVLKLEVTADAPARATHSCGALADAMYESSVRVYCPSTNYTTNSCGGSFPTTSIIWGTVEDAWETIAVGASKAIVSNILLYARRVSDPNVVGDIGYFDSAVVIRHSLLTYASAWPNCRIRATVTTPSSGVCPLHIVFRLADGLTYSMLRLTPATAGNDVAIIERVAGVETTRAQADKDLTHDTEYDVRIDVRGSQIDAHLDGVLATSYASAVGADYRNVGVELLDTSGWAVSSFEVERL